MSVCVCVCVCVCVNSIEKKAHVINTSEFDVQDIKMLVIRFILYYIQLFYILKYFV